MVRIQGAAEAEEIWGAWAGGVTCGFKGPQRRRRHRVRRSSGSRSRSRRRRAHAANVKAGVEIRGGGRGLAALRGRGEPHARAVRHRFSLCQTATIIIWQICLGVTAGRCAQLSRGIRTTARPARVAFAWALARPLRLPGGRAVWWFEFSKKQNMV